MGHAAIGYVYRIVKHANGDVEIGFYDLEKNSADSYSTVGGAFPKEIAHTLAATLGRNVWAKIEFDDKGAAVSVGLEEYNFDKDVKGLKKKLRKLVVTGS